MMTELNQPSTDSAAPLIGMTEVEKKYGHQRVLRIESLGIHEKDFVVITGVNGAGKSTLLRLLAGVSRPSSGNVWYDPGYTDLKIAYAPQAGGLHRHLTILENLDACCRMRGKAIDAAILESWYFEEVGLSEQFHKPIHELSGGFQKLATISCALGTEPDGLFLDEPFSGLDDEKSALLFERLADFSHSRAFVVITTHQVAKPELVSRTIGLLNGKMI